MSNQAPPFSIADLTAQWAQNKNLTLWYERETTSTNQIAKQNANSDQNDFKLYLTSYQSAGRGRSTNHWLSPAVGDSLLSSWSFACTKVPQPILAPLVGLAVFEACSNLWPELPWSLKAPNDLYLDNKKVAGILIEMTETGAQKRVIIGLGLNVFSHPKEIETATSMAAEQDLAFSEIIWTRFLIDLFANLREALSVSFEASLTDSYRARILEALNLNPVLSEKILSVEPNGSLKTRTRLIDWSEL
jgi:BirA family biotin operon repressor/biotin-[acetyl-CoA-carboxylase] ligase